MKIRQRNGNPPPPWLRISPRLPLPVMSPSCQANPDSPISPPCADDAKAVPPPHMPFLPMASPPMPLLFWPTSPPAPIPLLPSRLTSGHCASSPPGRNHAACMTPLHSSAPISKPIKASSTTIAAHAAAKRSSSIPSSPALAASAASSPGFAGLG